MPFVSLIPAEVGLSSRPVVAAIVAAVIVGLRSKSPGGAERLRTGSELSERGRGVWCVSAAKPLSPLQECEQRPAVGNHRIHKRLQLPAYCNIVKASRCPAPVFSAATMSVVMTVLTSIEKITPGSLGRTSLLTDGEFQKGQKFALYL